MSSLFRLRGAASVTGAAWRSSGSSSHRRVAAAAVVQAARPFSATGGEALATVREYIEGNDVVVFAKTTCGFCSRVQGLFASLSLDPPPVYVQLNQLPDGRDLQQALAEMTGQRTVPNVWVKGKHIGGCDDTFKAHFDGSLEDLLDA
jgi:glutaredoxin 3